MKLKLFVLLFAAVALVAVAAQGSYAGSGNPSLGTCVGGSNPGEGCDPNYLDDEYWCPDGGICVPVGGCLSNADCDDNIFCNGTETCNPDTGACLPGLICPAAIIGCIEYGSCDEENDTCPGIPNDAHCGVGEFCNADIGECEQVAPGCTSDADCDDGDFCNGTETCNTDTGGCQVVSACPPVAGECIDGQYCDEDNDQCVVIFDDDLCAPGEFCNAGVCEVIPPQPPANDLCDDADGPLTVASVTPGTTVDATSDVPPAPDFCGTSITAPGVWYTVMGTGNTMTASTCNEADYDTKISVFCADCEAPTCVAGVDDSSGCAGFTTSLPWASQAGAEYLVLVHGFGGATGNFNLAILDDGVPTTADVICNVVDIDIKPGSFPNSINTKSCKGVIPVAILGSDTLDASTVNVTTLAFGPDGASPAHDLTVPETHYEHLQDVNLDGFTDLVSHYQCIDTGIAAGDTEACLSGFLGSNCYDSRPEPGCDDQVCEDTVCAIDPWCCNFNWDSICVIEAIDLCNVDATPFYGCDSVRTAPGGQN